MAKTKNNLLLVRQLDKKIKSLSMLKEIIPSSGWVSTIRQTLNMSLRQLGQKMAITPQGLRSIEIREPEGAVTLKSLKEVANAMDMDLVYGFVPRDGSLEKMIERKAHNLATIIVSRTSTTMKLEDQENSKQRIKDATQELADELKRELSRSLWD